MSAIIFEIIFIIILVFANGVFAMSELAVVSSRKARLRQMADEGSAKARIALNLADSPDRFLSTIQIGITLVGISAGALGGATIAEELGALLSTVPMLSPYSNALAMGIVVLSITYLSLIFGELVPKRLALNNPERIAMRAAGPMRTLSEIASPAVTLLGASTRAVLKILRIQASTEPPVTEEEIKVLLDQGTEYGIFDEAERRLVRNVFRLEDKRVGALMTQRMDVVWLDVEAPFDLVRQKMAESRYSRFPVCSGNLDRVLGVVKAKELLVHHPTGSEYDWSSLMKPPLFIPEFRSALDSLESFKRAHSHIALVIDEYGAVAGLITTNDILEAIVGDISMDPEQLENHAVQREDGSWLLDGVLSLADFREIFPIGELPGEEQGAYHTVAGFVMARLGRIPSTADSFEWRGLRFEVVDMDGNRIDKVLVASLGNKGDQNQVL